MNLKTLDKFLLILLATFLIIDSYVFYTFQRTPTEENIFVPTSIYWNSAVYSYIVEAKPSVLYDNRTLIPPGEPIFIPLAKNVIITLSYFFSSDPDHSDISLKCEVYATLEAKDAWKKSYTLMQLKEEGSSTFQELLLINITQIDSMIQTIERETRINLNSYTYTITPKIFVNATIAGKTINHVFKPELKLIFNYSGNRIEFDSLQKTDEQKIGIYKSVPAEWKLNLLGTNIVTTTVKNMRTASILILPIPTVAIAVLIYFLMRRPPISPITIINRKLRNRLVETIMAPEDLEKKQIVMVSSIGDIEKAAEEAVKPILYNKRQDLNNEEIINVYKYYVIDENIVYTYKIKEKISIKNEYDNKK
ncbi:hypothetical protein KEJ47_10155, partial [Candidatus Bathyarchaeota archaeon]|nr:hypothetical protein [Candidatus Bathyarchaeota archaeon]